MLTVSVKGLLEFLAIEIWPTDSIQELPSPLAEVSHTVSHLLASGLP
jgi:hypothetical protein